MLEREFGTPPARVTESDHQVAPGVFIVEHDRCRARGERPVGEFADRPAGVQVEHGHIGPAQQCVRMGVAGIECNGPLQQLLRSSMVLRAHAPHVRHCLHDQIPCIDALRRLSPHAHRLGHENLRPDRADDAIGDVVLKREDIREFAIVSVRP